MEGEQGVSSGCERVFCVWNLVHLRATRPVTVTLLILRIIPNHDRTIRKVKIWTSGLLGFCRDARGRNEERQNQVMGRESERQMHPSSFLTFLEALRGTHPYVAVAHP